MSWKNVDEMFDAGAFHRGDPARIRTVRDPNLPEGSVTLIEVPALAISSTDCRGRVAGGEPVWYLVPDGVVQYIGKHRLYQQLRIGSGLPAPTR